MNHMLDHRFSANNPGWRLRDIQRWSALIQSNFWSNSALFITWKSLKSANLALNQRWKRKLQSKKNIADFWQIQNDSI